MLAASTSPGTWIAIGTLVVMMVPVYISSLRGAKSYGRLEEKVDALAVAASTNAAANAETNRLLAEAITKLTDQFVDHSVQDAEHFGELRGILRGKDASAFGKARPVV